ncbi:hypothetical protein HK098_002398 [Nowakowskiella sp. JEL0407]|nr:hypothetical protein HK098_002398 [Nowakowskiella sp. JEL0407]
MACNDLNDDEYTKSSYDYRIRWLYGQEGRRVEMHMPSCQAMLTSPQEQPTAGDKIAGCLFAKRFSSEFRQESIGAIAKRNVGNSILMDIEDLVQRDRPQAACALLFKGVYNRSCGGDVMKNPVEWYVMAASKNI